MSELYVVGNVTSIDGTRVSALMHENTNLLSYFYDGTIYRGVNIGEYVGIIRGPYKIVARIEKEYLEDRKKDVSNQSFEINRFERIIELNIIGSFLNGKFEFGIRCFPLIYNEVVLLTDNDIKTVIQGDYASSEYVIPLGKSVQEEISISLPWDKIFNTHIGIFGNTGSGKSNTLAKLYTELFNLNGNEINLEEKSRFIFFDFNGEYTGKNVLADDKKVINLSTRTTIGDRITLSPENFWDIDTLSILYSATEKTQRPFLQATLSYYIDKETHDISTEKLINHIGSGFYNVFIGNNHKEMLPTLNKILQEIGLQVNKRGIYVTSSEEYELFWLLSNWNSNSSSYYVSNKLINQTKDKYLNNVDRREIKGEREKLEKVLQSEIIKENLDNLTLTQKLSIIAHLRLIFGLANNYVQFEHISPLIQRIESNSNFIDKIIQVGDPEDLKTITVISMKNCRQDAKKMIPLLIAKQLYQEHKNDLQEDVRIEKTVHLVIDEAHNILSEQSNREEASWKDYRLEVFEEIIKEGRKFGFYLTIASQRPFDISPTIISQVHNHFLHRLVNELDIKMISNTISTLDSLSKQKLTMLMPGQCIISGTSFDMPILLQVDRLDMERVPNSDSANLVALWDIGVEKD